MTDLAIPNTFVTGTPALSAEVNANFDAVETIINTTGIPKVQDGVVGNAGLASDAGPALLATVSRATASSTLLTSSDASYIATSSVSVAFGRTYEISGWVVVDNASSGANRNVIFAPRFNGAVVDTSYPVTVELTFISGASNRSVMHFCAVWTAGAGSSGVADLRMRADSGAAVALREGRLSIRRL